MKIRVNVKQEHIDVGERCSFCYCPVAYAVEDALVIRALTASYIMRGVYQGYIRLANNPDNVLYKEIPYSKKVNNFISQFDRGHEVEPFYFYITLPEISNENT